MLYLCHVIGAPLNNQMLNDVIYPEKQLTRHTQRKYATTVYKKSKNQTYTFWFHAVNRLENGLLGLIRTGLGLTNEVKKTGKS